MNVFLDWPCLILRFFQRKPEINEIKWQSSQYLDLNPTCDFPLITTAPISKILILG